MKSLVLTFCCVFCINIAQAEERILALAPHACEMLYAIGAQAEVVGASSYCDYPQAAKSLPRVSAYNRINVEAAIALKPTLAIVMDEKMQGVQKLRELGVTIVRSYPQKVDEVFADIRKLGLLSGHSEKAELLARGLEARLLKLQGHSKHQPIKVFYEIWSEPLLTTGKHTFIHDVLTRMGLRNVFGALELDAPRVNVESVLNAQPQLVIVPSENRDITERAAYWQKWLGKDIQVITVNPDLLHRPGPRLLDGMEDLKRQLEGLHVTG